MTLFFLAFLLLPLTLEAHEEKLHEIEVRESLDFELPASHIHQDSVVKKEVLSQNRIEHKNATSLSRAVDLEPGVQTTLTCATCGSQRITLNGLRSENTVIMIDGLPAFSSVSSFYGMEAMPLAGIAQIEIMRGAGASLTAPEAIGGVVNLVTMRPEQNKVHYNLKAGEHQFFNQQLWGSYGDTRGGVMVAAQTNQMGKFDEDNNDVAESSSQLQKSFFFKQEQRLQDKFKFSWRAGYQELELLGGAEKHYRTNNYPGALAGADDFEGGDVHRSFTGSPDQISDRIFLKRIDGGGSFLYHMDSDTNAKFSFSLASSMQDSVYFHGYDYKNQDMFRFFDLRVNRVINQNHLLTIGVDQRNEEMNSSSQFLYNENNLFRDSFTFDTLGFYVQDEWFLTEKDELNLVLRIDKLDVNWKDKRLSYPELEKTVIAPRLHYKRLHNDSWSSRLSIGKGYRAPLTLFESQHGTNEEGFELEIKDIEKAYTATYTLNFEGKERSMAVSASQTHLQNMAYGDEEEEPIKFKNADETMKLTTLNYLHVEKINPNWNVEMSLDWFIMPAEYKEKLPIAAQEKRARFISDYHFGKNELVFFLNVVGPRDLRPYHYNSNYQVLSVDPDTLEDVASQQKNLRAPLFATADLYFQREIHKSITWQFGIQNIFDYTQAKREESPLAWRQHGEHVHLDNRHIWGPNTGRVIYTGFKAEL